MTLSREFDFSSLDHWENRKENESSSDPLKECKKFPDHDCETCHSYHVSSGDFNPHCSICMETKCPGCSGDCYMKDGSECQVCKGQGRV